MLQELGAVFQSRNLCALDPRPRRSRFAVARVGKFGLLHAAADLPAARVAFGEGAGVPEAVKFVALLVLAFPALRAGRIACAAVGALRFGVGQTCHCENHD